MADAKDIRRGRHCVFALHVHLVFLTKYRRCVFDAEAIGEINHFSLFANQLIGVAVLGALVGYYLWVGVRKWRARPLIFDLALPGPMLTFGQMTLGVIDVCSAALISAG